METMTAIALVCPTFFPDYAVAGIRMTQWAKLLPSHGFKPLVLCRHNGVEPSATELANKVHPEVVLHYLGPKRIGFTATRQAAHARIGPLSRLGKQLLVPDASVVFWATQHDSLLRVARGHRPSLVLSSGPPHGVHLAGARLARSLRVPWVADFRDPYRMDPRFAPQGFGHLVGPAHWWFEREIYRRAALICHAIPAHARDARRRYAFAEPRIVTLTNGYPPELERAWQRPPKRGGRITVCAAGQAGRHMLTDLCRAIATLVDGGHDLELVLVGPEPPDQRALLQVLPGRLCCTGPVSHDDAVGRIASADILINAVSTRRLGVKGISSKLFEYLATACPVIAVNSTGPDQELLSGQPGVLMLGEPDVAAWERALSWALAEMHNPNLRQGPRLGEAFSRRAQVARLAEHLRRLAPKPTACVQQPPLG